MEIERKFLIRIVPEDVEMSRKVEFEQGYLSTSPVVRVRREGDEYFLTYKNGGMMVREEYNLPLTEESYKHLLGKIDNNLIYKTRYRIPMDEFNGNGSRRIIELDVFHGNLAPLKMAEVEFPSVRDAEEFVPPAWFGREVTYDRQFHNNYLATVSYKDLIMEI